MLGIRLREGIALDGLPGAVPGEADAAGAGGAGPADARKPTGPVVPNP